MEMGSNDPITGRWCVREIAIRTGETWQSEQTFEGESYLVIFSGDSSVTAIADGKLVYHGKWWHGANSALLDLHGNSLKGGSLFRKSEHYRTSFDGDNELFLYSTEPGENDVPGYKRFHLIRIG